ncbi:hypothetical protein RHMOL_Rhmol01G0230400 [Rhododendron molle]|uniref:Uncharacterized protein n=1 Tax=Rhododendron molle TaxID=49168 RepID=A0ACC0Q5U6_RHOML|nr:hypothetical protein RHMOL_Rhmol01G0230400 [Rhododendron molle]
MDAAQWSQEVGMVKLMDETTPMSATNKPMMLERKVRPQKDQALNCPRCNSTNTKFCYYNNYSLTQPRYFCKTCRRYWTDGGSLRNVPVGGGSRKNKRSSNTSSSTPASSSHKLPDLNPPISLSPFSSSNSLNPNSHQGQDLNLGFPHAMQDYLSISQFVQFPKIQNNSSSSSSSSANTSALELLRAGISTSRGLHSFISTQMPADSNVPYGALGFHLQELKPNLGFAVDGAGSFMYPFGGVKQVSTTSGVDPQSNKGQGNSNGYWNGMLGGGSW